MMIRNLVVGEFTVSVSGIVLKRVMKHRENRTAMD